MTRSPARTPRAGGSRFSVERGHLRLRRDARRLRAARRRRPGGRWSRGSATRSPTPTSPRSSARPTRARTRSSPRASRCPRPRCCSRSSTRVLFALIDERLEVFEDAIGRRRRPAGARRADRRRFGSVRASGWIARSRAPASTFEVTVAGDEVEHGKPAPDMFLAAAAAAGRRAGALRRGRGLGAGRRGRARGGDADARHPAGPRHRSLGRHGVVDTISADAILAMLP